MAAYYRRGLNWLRTVYLPAPVGGWNPDGNAWELPDNQAPVLDNFLIRPGKIVARGPFVKIMSGGWSDAYPISAILADTAVTSASPSGVMTVWNRADDLTGTHYIDPWNAVLLNAPAANLAQADTVHGPSQISLDGGTVWTAAPLTADQVVGPRWINYDGLLYAISYDAVAAAVSDTNSSYSIKPLNLLTMPSLQVPGTVVVPTVLTNAPHGAFDVIGYLRRVWLLGGVDTPGGLTAHEPTTIYFTNPGDSGVGTASADWKDPVLGTTNKLHMDNNNSDYGVGLAQAPSTLVIFRRSSVWALRGTTSSSFVLRAISHEVGCLDARSIVTTDKGVFFISQRGLEFTDGISVRNTSGPVQQDLLTAINQSQQHLRRGGGQTSSYITAASTSQGHILVTVGTVASTLPGTNPAIMTTIWAGMYDPATGIWTRHTSLLWAAFNFPVLLVGRSDRQQLYSLGNGLSIRSGDVVQLENPAYGDYPNWGNSFLVPNNTQNGLEDLVLPGTNRFTIPIIWVSRVIPMDVSHKRAQMKRYFLDYTLNSTNASTGRLRVTPHGVASDSAFDAPLTAASSGAPAPQWAQTHVQPVASPKISRVDKAQTSEISDMYFIVDSTFAGSGGGLGNSLMEVYGIGTELASTRDYDAPGS